MLLYIFALENNVSNLEFYWYVEASKYVSITDFSTHLTPRPFVIHSDLRVRIDHWDLLKWHEVYFHMG